MADEKQLKQASTAFTTLCGTLDSLNWKYEKDEAQLSIESGAQGEDLPIDINIKVDVDRMLILLLSLLPFVTPDDKRLDMAVAVSAANNLLVDGSFDYDIKQGRMFFRMTSSFRESLVGKDLFTYMLLCSCKTIDDFNDKFMMLAKGLITLEQFFETINK